MKSSFSLFCMLMCISGIGLAENTTNTTIVTDKFSPVDFIKNKTISIQLGGFLSSQGKAQLIDINGTNGDYFSITNQNSGNGLVGLSYYLDGKETTRANFSYGIDAFYLAQTKVTGNIAQEQLFNNLSYNYSITNWPIYFAAKALVKTKSENENITLDVGIGPNIIQTSNFNEQPLLGSVIPDHLFKGQTTTTFSAMAGIGYKINNILGPRPLECGYRFFYLGQTNLRNLNTQIMNNFTTGQSYANALLCAITI